MKIDVNNNKRDRMITGNAKIAGVIGDPIQHSLSPVLHNYWLKIYKIDGAYVPFHVVNEQLEHVITSLRSYGIQGINVTVPHKESVMKYVDVVEPEAQEIGAVNTIYVENNRLIGTNTDAYGFIYNLKAKYPTNTDLNGMHVLIIGAGGAARAAIYGLLKEQVASITLCNRTLAKAKELKEYFGESVYVIEYEDRESILSSTDLVVNTTSLGMVGKNTLELDLRTLKKGAMVYDIVYNPLETHLLKTAKELGYQTITGIGMLLHQAVPGFEKWFGIKPEIDDHLEQYVLEALK